MTEKKKNTGGRPTKYKPEYAEQATRLCLLGMNNEELAHFFQVEVQTITNWLNDHEEFFGAVHAGREAADGKVVAAFYKKACGFEVDDEKIFNAQGVPMKVPYTRIVDPDPGAALNWLKNRQPDKWTDKKEVKLDGSITVKKEDLDDRLTAILGEDEDE